MSGSDEEVTTMAMDTETLSSSLVALLAPIGLLLHDVEITKGLVRVTVTSPEGVPLEKLTAANHSISAYFDDNEPLTGRYTLEVTSPGVERKLRTAEHFVGAIGEEVRIKTTPEAAAERRVEGVLRSANGNEITIDLENGDSITLQLDQVDRARTVYAWGPQPKPSPSRGGSSKSKRSTSASVQERIMTP